MLSRRATLLLLALPSLLAGAFATASASNPAPDRPNIIYILADDLGYGDLSCYGQRKFQTPNIDRLAEEGMKFTDHYAGCTVCAPSRASLMTGFHTGHCLVRGNYETGPHGFGGELPLRPQDVTIGEVLHDAGYHTALIGKWGMGMDGTTGGQKKHRFLYWEFHERGFTEQAVRMGPWKAVRHGPDRPLELYDLRTDIGEETNVAAANPEVVATISEYLNRARTPSQLWPLKRRGERGSD